MDVKELAVLVQEVLDAQQKFFKGGKKLEDLEHSKALEKNLRNTVKEILKPNNQKELFS